MENWFQGETSSGFFDAQAGPPNSYIGANVDSTSTIGTRNTISNWLIAPTQTFNNGDVISFYTRKVDQSNFPDRLQVRFSSSGASDDVGTLTSDVGVFSTWLLDINSTLSTAGYPIVWTQFLTILSNLSGPTLGRFAFRYFVTNGGFNGSNSDYIGIDTVSYTAVPEPTLLVLLAIVGACVFISRRRRMSAKK